MPRFVTRPKSDQAPESPEGLFALLRPVDPNLRHLWSHQADTLRAYHGQALSATDVAVELPTGSGKTLVGLLLADWRRRARNERVAYLCPTRHLARQVGARATDYGLPAVVLVGKSDDWPPADHIRYSRSESVAITTYSTLFNTNPRLDDADVLLFDDAHAGEGYVADMWSLKATRNEALYMALVDAVRGELPTAFAERLADEAVPPVDRAYTEILGPHQLAPNADLIREALLAHAEGNAAYTRTTIGGAIDHCILYVNWRELLIRPFIPPTLFHDPFASAHQRVYMSATLGAGGELERAFGVPSILRLPIPTGWQEYGAGRRYFMVPGATLESEVADNIIDAAIVRAQRVLVITPSDFELNHFRERLPKGMTTISAPEIEADPGLVARRGRAAMLLANRYDGIDLPDETCRLIVLAGLPSATHLQERFLYERLGAKRVLAERIRTRIVQGAGRCTRNAKDFAAVILRGASLIDWVSRSENVQPMRPDLQAEIEFGLDNTDNDFEGFLALLGSFLDQDADWSEADANIRAQVLTKSQVEQPGSQELSLAAPFEVRAWQSAWRGDLADAVTQARRATDEMSGTAVASYRALWLFLAASWARSAARNTSELENAAALARDAEECARTMAWRPRLGGPETPREYPIEYGPRDERAARVLVGLNIRGPQFERHIASTLALLADKRASSYEQGLQRLGELLGFESSRPNGAGAPDGLWSDEPKAWFVFEAKTEVNPATPISMREVRQATSHPDWLVGAGLTRPEFVGTVLVSAQGTIGEEAATIARELAVAHPDLLDQVAEQTFRALRSVRTAAPGMTDEQIAAAIKRAFRAARLDTDSLVLRLTQRPAAHLGSGR